MKKALFLSLFLVMAFGFSSVAMAYEPYEGGIWTSVKTPSGEVSNQRLGSKVGRATCTNYVGLVKVGDCSLKAAMKNGHISKVNGADWEKSWKVIYGTKTFVVYGD